MKQKSEIRKYIYQLDKINICTRPQMILGTANYLIHFENYMVSHYWLKRLLKHNPEYHVRKQKFLLIDRKDNQSVNNISDYFEKFERVIRKKGIIYLKV